MTTLPATRRGFGRQDAPDTATPAEIPLPRLPTPGPAAQGILALFDEAAAGPPAASHSIH